MNAPKVREEDYIAFLIATARATCCEASRAANSANLAGLSNGPPAPSHDSYNRLLHRLEPTSDQLWNEASRFVDCMNGVLVLDDSILDKPYSRNIELVGLHWSGKHHRFVQGICLVSLVWSNGDCVVPCDYDIYDASQKDLTKHDHFRAMLDVAKQRGFQPRAVLFDQWYASLENLKHIQSFGWTWLTRLKGNRIVSLDN